MKELDKYRYERKLYVVDLDEHEIEMLIKLHPAMFSEIYYARFVNNIYLDTFRMDSYFANVDGLTERAKFRVRWYGDLFGLIEKPVLEVKRKQGLLGIKEACAIAPFVLDHHFNTDRMMEAFKESALPEHLRMHLYGLDVSLLNRYKRKYFQSFDRKYRITLDSQMSYHEIRGQDNTFLNKSIDRNGTIVEVKYDAKNHDHVESILNHFPVRVTKCSKYVTGKDSLLSW
jgi:SPX domain protein involved in polyphosphate accumulation